jgi:hypothetical protein
MNIYQIRFKKALMEYLPFGLFLIHVYSGFLSANRTFPIALPIYQRV